MVLRILHCYKSYMPDEVGGVAEAISLITSARDPEFNHSILVSRPRGLGRDFAYEGVPVHAVTSLGTIASLPIAPGYPFALAQRARSVDVIAHHCPFPLTDLSFLLGISNKPVVVVHWHADLELSKIASFWVKPLLKNSLKRASRIIVAHESVLHSSPFLQSFSEKCVIIPYGVDFAYWANLNAEERDQVAAIRREHPRLIVSTGRLVPYKGHRVLLQAMQNVDATLCIIGTGILQRQLERTVQELKLGDRVIMKGWQERQQLKMMLHAARVFAFSSLTSAESFGIAQLEAMATGLPIVNTALKTAVPYIARHEIESLTVEPGNVADLGLALTKLLQDQMLAAKLGRASRIRARSFDQRSVREKIQKVYMETVTHRY